MSLRTLAALVLGFLVLVGGVSVLGTVLYANHLADQVDHDSRDRAIRNRTSSLEACRRSRERWLIINRAFADIRRLAAIAAQHTPSPHADELRLRARTLQDVDLGPLCELAYPDPTR